MVPNFIFFEQGFKYIPTIVLIKVNCGTASLLRGDMVGAVCETEIMTEMDWIEECKELQEGHFVRAPCVQG
jgi:hypothetical protein